MKLEHSLKTDVNEVILRERITTYLTKSGYRLVSSQPTLSFQRGSMLGSGMSFSPRSWKSEAVLGFSPVGEQTTQVSIMLDINTTGQWVTDKERKFWQVELDNLVQAVSSGNIDTGATTKNAKAALTQNLIALVLIIGLGLVMAIGGLLIFGTYNASLFTALLGIGLGFLIAQRWLNFKIRG
jgi:hypothetical protein